MRATPDAAPPRGDRFLAALPALACAALAVLILRETAGFVLPFLAKVAGILAPVMVAFALAYLLDPVVDRLQGLGLPRGLAIGVLLLTAVVTLAAAVLLVIPSVLHEWGLLGPKVTAAIHEATAAVKASAGDRQAEVLQRAMDWGTEALAALDWSLVAGHVRSLLATAASGGFVAIGWLLDLVLIPVLAVYLLHDIDDLRDRLAALVPPRHRRTVLEPLREVDAALSGFVRGQLSIAAILGLIYALGLALSGTPLGIVIGLVAGALAFIPYLGLALGLVPALLLTLVAHGVSWNLLGVVLTFVIAQLLEGWIITPRIMKGSLGLHPVLVIMAVVAGGSFAGVTGMLLGVPAAAAAMVFLRRGHDAYLASSFFRTGRSSAWHARQARAAARERPE